MVNKKAEGTYEDTLNKSEAFFMRHGKTAIIAIVAVLVVVAGFFLYRTFIVEPQEEEAQQYDQALKAFQKVQSDYSSTDAGNLANLYVGLCYAHQEKPNWAKALEYVQKFSTSNDQIISPASQMALGDIYANNNQNDKAVESFKKAADMANAKGFEGVNISIAPLALRKAGIILESEGKKADALKLYQEIKTKYVTSPMYQDIDKYIERASN